jgi:hypothetical protein
VSLIRGSRFVTLPKGGPTGPTDESSSDGSCTSTMANASPPGPPPQRKHGRRPSSARLHRSPSRPGPLSSGGQVIVMKNPGLARGSEQPCVCGLPAHERTGVELDREQRVPRQGEESVMSEELVAGLRRLGVTRGILREMARRDQIVEQSDAGCGSATSHGAEGVRAEGPTAVRMGTHGGPLSAPQDACGQLTVTFDPGN